MSIEGPHTNSLCLFPAPPAPRETPIVTTTLGQVRGRLEGKDVNVFRGIPYAASTAGDNRFKPPQPREPWTGVLEATAYGPGCPQPPSPFVMTISEDCLTANVWTPDMAGKRPVMVWFHGGAWTTGFGGLISPDEAAQADFAARGDVVLVSVTHRLNVFGFLTLGEEFGPDYASSANVGMLDLAAALEWVRDNIVQFGGDPDNVTIFGLSGGGAKVSYSLAMPAFKGLFHRAIVIAGHDLWKRNSLESAMRYSREVLDEIGIARGDVATLKHKSFESIIHAYDAVCRRSHQDPQWGYPSWIHYDQLAPSIGTADVPLHPVDALAQGAADGIDIMVGLSRLDHWLPQFKVPENFGYLSRDELVLQVGLYLGEAAESIVGAYEGFYPHATPSTLLAFIMTDSDWGIPHVRMAEACPAGVWHFYDQLGTGTNTTNLMFGADKSVPACGADQIRSAFVNFARTGNPNGPGIVSWKRYTAQSRDTMIFDYDSRMGDVHSDEVRRVWEGVR